MQCAPESPACFVTAGVSTATKCRGESAALKYAKWLFTGAEVTKSMSSLGAAPASPTDRARVLKLLTFECNPVTLQSEDKADNTMVIVGSSAGILLLIMLICGVYILRERRRLRLFVRRGYHYLPVPYPAVHDMLDVRVSPNFIYCLRVDSGRITFN